MSSECTNFPWRLSSIDRTWPKPVAWGCGHVTNLERGGIVKSAESVLAVFHDPVRHWATCRAEVMGDKLGSKAQIARVATNLARYGYGMLENLARTAPQAGARPEARQNPGAALRGGGAARRRGRYAVGPAGREAVGVGDGDRLAQMAWQAELWLPWDAHARAHIEAKVGNFQEEQLDVLRGVFPYSELWLTPRGGG
ncbi:hypothetical protein DL764_000504 [Monosporascus ibericus]|uniref:Uncharacterized protein n=1 Tax=Monosporascus ibericus TaxID=155417 RepID=A0A4Q4TVV0_9PEZI|nr:hypothetical protein DL764_000504 [Monosporascus ibericus]